MRKIVYGKMMDGYRNFHIITRGGGMCYGRFYEGSDWAYVHYRSHINGTDYMPIGPVFLFPYPVFLPNLRGRSLLPVI